MAVEREEGAIEVAGDGLGFTVSEDVDALGERFFRVSVGGVVVLGEAGGTGIEADVAPAGVPMALSVWRACVLKSPAATITSEDQISAEIRGILLGILFDR